ncbi:MAG: acyltransferase [Muribaculaceae bacterium]|nr:acyltransferase [Muribaculaceae bacterium]
MSYETEGQLMSKQETNWFRGMAALMVVLSHYAEWWGQIMQPQGRIKTLCDALSKLGVYGVDMFFLFSGYAMVKSLGQENMSFRYVWKRIKNVYIPYLCIIGVQELLSGGFTSFHDFLLFLTGYDYWYMLVLFLFYIGFIVIYALVRVKTPRVLLFCVFTYAMSYILYCKGMKPFWYVSNITFALGVIAGEYEGWFRRIVDKAALPMIIICGIGMIFVVRFGMTGGVNIGGDPQEYQIWFQIGATLIWTLLILNLAAKCRMKEKIGAFLGKNSLYLYLTHTFFFMRCVNSEGLGKALEFINHPGRIMLLRFILGFLTAAAVSFLCGLAFNGLYRLGKKKN